MTNTQVRKSAVNSINDTDTIPTRLEWGGPNGR